MSLSTGLRPSLLLLIYVSVALAPLAIAYAMDLPVRPWRDELASALALIGFSMLLLEFLLSGRFKTVSNRVGIDITMRFHQLAARSLTVFLLIHPYLYTLPNRPRLPWDDSGQLSVSLTGAPLLSGLLAWLILPVLAAWAMFHRRFPYRYETWRLWHGLGAAALAIFGLHHTLGAGRYSASGGVLTAFWLLLVGAALTTLVVVYIVRPLWQLRHAYRLVSKEKIAEKTWQLELEPLRGEALRFEPGQFVWLTINRSPFAITEHPFSISSCPADRPRIGFMIKEVGDFTSTVESLPLGARAYLDGPHGHLVLSGRGTEGLVLIAGGVGLAPIMSILRQLYAERDRRPIKLIYGNRSAVQITFAEELERFKTRLRMELIYVLSEPPAQWCGATGLLDERTLRRCLNEDERRHRLYVVCGPALMIDSVEDTLARIGVPQRLVLTEKFTDN